MLWGLIWYNLGVRRGPGWLRLAETRLIWFMIPWMFMVASTYGASGSRRIWWDPEMQLFFALSWLTLLGLTALFGVRGIDVVVGVRAASVWTGPGVALWSSVVDLECLSEVRLIWLVKQAPFLGLLMGQRQHRSVTIQLIGPQGLLLWSSSPTSGGVVRHDGTIWPLGGSALAREAAAELSEALGAPLVEKTLQR